MTALEIMINGENVGTVRISSQLPWMRRTATGFLAHLPLEITLRDHPRTELRAQSDVPQRVLLSTLFGTLFAVNAKGQEALLGSVRSERSYHGPSPLHSSIPGQLVWEGSFAQLAFVERYREGQRPRFYLELAGTACLLIKLPEKIYDLRSNEWESFGRSNFEYPKEEWVRCLREMKIADNVLVEIPLRSAPPTPWDEVWGGLIEARNSFEQGGTTGWKGTVTAARLALERWQQIEKEQMGAGWTAPSPADRQKRTKQERLDNIRWHLLQLAHLGAHSGSDEWSRDDAVLMLSVLSALLAERNP
jgi:hypothetical protein